MENFQQKNGYPRLEGSVVRIFAVFGFVAVLGIGMWGSVKIAEAVPRALSSLAATFASLTSVFVPAHQTLSVSAPSAVIAGAPFTLSWTNSNKHAEGSYVFRYDCAGNAYFTSPALSGTNANVYCNVPFNFLNSNDAITLTPVMTGAGPITVTAYIDFIPNGSKAPAVSGKTSLTVEAGAPDSPHAAIVAAPKTSPVVSAPGPETTRTYLLGGGGAARPSDPNGFVDLSVRILEVGVVDKNSGVFTASSTPSLSVATSSSQYRVAVRFAIENVGTKTSPQFDFNAVLPTMPAHTFTSPLEQGLAPGDRIEFTLGFDSLSAPDTAAFTVTVDPSNRITDTNKSNNIIHYMITTAP